MKNLRLVVVMVIALATSAAAQMASHASTLKSALDQPVARVNSSILTQRDLLREMYALFPYARQHGGKFPKELEADIRKGALDMIIFEELAYQEALRQKLTITPTALARAEASFRKQFPSPDRYQEYLKVECQGSERILREKVRRSLLIDAVLKAEINKQSEITPAELRAYYDKNSKQFEHGETFSIQTISIIPPENGSPDVQREAKKRAEDALQQAKASKTYREFGLLAEKLSEDDWHVNMGDRKDVDAAKLPPPIAEAARKMKPGDVSELFQFGSAYTLFRLNGHTPAGNGKFDDVKTKLQSDLQKMKTEQLRTALNDRLRKNAKIEVL